MKTQRILIVSPVFNEWTSVKKLLEEIDTLELNKQIGILLVNDGSTEAYHSNSLTKAYRSIHNIQVIPLRRNLGHQVVAPHRLEQHLDRAPVDLAVARVADAVAVARDLRLLLLTGTETASTSSFPKCSA